MGKHFINDDSGVSAEVQTIDGKVKYWRVMPPYKYKRGLRYRCECGRKFWSYEHYELHFTRAYEEEQMVETNSYKSKRKPPNGKR